MARSALAQATLSFITQQGLCAPSDALVVAISGGADSVALVHLLLELDYRPTLAHVNYGLRGEASDGDEAYVRALADELGLALYVDRPDTRAYAEAHALSMQVAARQLRYAFFDHVVELTGARWLCTAHHRDDVAETVLYSLARGKEFAVLQGIPVRRAQTIRPVLFARKAELADYLEQRGFAWRTDASNANPEQPRAYLRHTVLPLYEQVNPALVDQLGERLQLYGLQLRVLTQLIDARRAHYWLERDERISLDIDGLLRHEGPAFAALFLYYELEQRLGFSHAEVRRTRELLASQTGRYLEAQGWRITRDRGRLVFERLEPTPGSLAPPLALHPGEQRWGPWVVRLTVADDAELVQGLAPPPPPGVVWMDADAVGGQLVMRRWLAGDRLRPIGLGGEKKVSDILTDLKRTGLAREQSFVIVERSAQGDEVVRYLEGYRIDDGVALTDETTRAIELRFFLHEG